MRMRTPLAALLLAVLLTLLATPVAAQESEATICSNLSTVSWDVDLATITVAGASVEVLGCDDGELVGLELITTDGDLPEDGPRGAEVIDEVADFDLTDLEVGVEPVIGVRVYLVADDGEMVEFLSVTVEQRLFNPAGNEQLGLRQATTLLVAQDASYVVPDAPTGYETVDCEEVLATLPNDALPVSGPGTFTASASGTHVACFQQVPAPGGPGPGGPSVEPPEVLGVVIDQSDDAAAAGEQLTERTSSTEASVLGRTLARTGIDATALLAISLLLLVVGGRLVLHRRRMRTE